MGAHLGKRKRAPGTWIYLSQHVLGVMHEVDYTKTDGRFVTFDMPKVRTLGDMTADEIEQLEREYKAAVVPERFGEGRW